MGKTRTAAISVSHHEIATTQSMLRHAGFQDPREGPDAIRRAVGDAKRDSSRMQSQPK